VKSSHNRLSFEDLLRLWYFYTKNKIKFKLIKMVLS